MQVNELPAAERARLREAVKPVYERHAATIGQRRGQDAGVARRCASSNPSTSGACPPAAGGSGAVKPRPLFRTMRMPPLPSRHPDGQAGRGARSTGSATGSAAGFAAVGAASGASPAAAAEQTTASRAGPS